MEPKQSLIELPRSTAELPSYDSPLAVLSEAKRLIYRMTYLLIFENVKSKKVAKVCSSFIFFSFMAASCPLKVSAIIVFSPQHSDEPSLSIARKNKEPPFKHRFMLVLLTSNA